MYRPRNQMMSYRTSYAQSKVGGTTPENVCSALDYLASVQDLAGIIATVPNFEEYLSAVEDFIERAYAAMYPDGEIEEDSEEEDIEPPRKKLKVIEMDE